MHVSEIDTPAVVIDLDVMERNLNRAAAYARSNGLRLRPHTKTHKIPSLARQQLALGAAGLTVAKVGEAEVMLASETPDLLVAYPIIGRRKLDRLVEVARKTRVTVSLDSPFAARQLSDAARAARVEFGVLAEVDMGLGRVGVAPKDAVALVQGIANLPHITFEGIAFYPGNFKVMDEAALEKMGELAQALERLVAEVEKAGYPCGIVSGGSTPTLFESHRLNAMTEIRPGTYIFNDRNTVACGSCSWDDCAASVHATVVSTAVRNQVIIDGGSKTFSSDRLVTSGEAGFGHLPDAPEAVFTKMNEEHGFLNVQRLERKLEIGDRVRVIPNHICVVMNLHERVYGVRNGEVEQVWCVEGRGKLQ
jgi:D-serine deaminase-like pyridoxal phosphate-dependent protein